MAERETSRSIDAQAAEWVARRDRAPLTAEEEAALQLWLEGDPRRPGAFLRAHAVALHSERARALGVQYDPADFGGAPVTHLASRRRLLAFSGLAATGVTAVGLFSLNLYGAKAYATERGEIRLAPLADGSTIMLNTETRVKVTYDDARRLVRFVGGEADFTVLPDPARPFVVEAAGQRLQTRGAAFRLRKLPNAPIDVLVYQGDVDIEPVKADRTAPLTLPAHTRLIVQDQTDGASAPMLRQVTPDAVTRDLAWREGKIAFEGETLAEAAAAFARYSDTRIIIDDPQLAREPVTGLFAASDPAGFSRAVAQIFDATVVTGKETVLLARREAAH